MDTPGKFVSISAKGDNFCDFIFALLLANPLLKKGLLYKERICSLWILTVTLRGTDTLSGKVTLAKQFLSPFWKRVYSKRKEFAPKGSGPYFRHGLMGWKVNRKSQKLSPLYKMAENLSSVSNPFNFIIVFTLSIFSLSFTAQSTLLCPADPKYLIWTDRTKQIMSTHRWPLNDASDQGLYHWHSLSIFFTHINRG